MAVIAILASIGIISEYTPKCPTHSAVPPIRSSNSNNKPNSTAPSNKNASPLETTPSKASDHTIPMQAS